MPFVVKENVSLDPVDISRLSAEGVVFAADGFPHLIQQARFPSSWGGLVHLRIDQWRFPAGVELSSLPEHRNEA